MQAVTADPRLAREVSLPHAPTAGAGDDAIDQDAVLVAAHLAGDPLAFTELVRRYQGRLLAHVARMIGDRDRGEDLVQEAFVRIHRHLGRFDPRRRFSTWAYAIAGNLAKNELRDRRRSPLVLHQTLTEGRQDGDRPLEFPDSSTQPDRLYRQRRLRALVEETVEQLGPAHREVFLLRELEGRSYEDIAEITGCSLGTVKSRLSRARTRFADLIRPHLD